MNHPREEILALAAAGDLPAFSAWQMRRHLAGCAECRASVDAYAQVRVELSALPVPEPPANLAPSILAALPREERARRGMPWFGWAAAGAVAVAAIALVTLNPTPDITSPPIFTARPAVPTLSATPTEPLSIPDPAPVAAPRFATLEDAEKDRDFRYTASAKSADLDRWAAGAPAQNQHLPQLVVGPRAEMLRSHALPGKVEVLALPGSPVQIVSAEALFAQGHLIDPVVEIRNTGASAIKDCQLIWVFRDASGNEFRGTIVAATKLLAPGARTRISQSIVLAPDGKNAEAQIAAARVFVRSAATSETVWVPERALLDAHKLGGFIPLPPATLQVLAKYRSEGVKAFAKLQ